MKKIILSLILIIAISPAFAQTVKFGISGGLNESSFSATNETGVSNSFLSGFHAGVFSDINFGKLSIEPGLFYTTKGNSSKQTLIFYDMNAGGGSGFSGNAHIKTIYNYLELPINFLYNIPVSYGKFFIGGGPYLAYGLSAKLNSKSVITPAGSSSQTTYQNVSIPFGSDEGDIKRFDFGVGALGGLALKNGLLFSIGFEHGLINTVEGGGASLKNNTLAVSLGYEFL